MSKVEEQGSEYKISSYPGYPISFSTLILKKLRGSIQSQELFFTLAVQSDLHLSQQQNESEKKVSLQVFTAILPWNLELTFTIYKKKAFHWKVTHQQIQYLQMFECLYLRAF